jgi:hypothetical protein
MAERIASNSALLKAAVNSHLTATLGMAENPERHSTKM